MSEQHTGEGVVDRLLKSESCIAQAAGTAAVVAVVYGNVAADSIIELVQGKIDNRIAQYDHLTEPVITE